MRSGARADVVRDLAARINDLRAECEAQLRAITRVEEELRKVSGGSADRWHQFERMLQRDLTDMLANNRDIRAVLTDLNKEIGGKSEAEIV
jgi:hypothetical protein